MCIKVHLHTTIFRSVTIAIISYVVTLVSQMWNDNNIEFYFLHLCCLSRKCFIMFYQSYLHCPPISSKIIFCLPRQFFFYHIFTTILYKGRQYKFQKNKSLYKSIMVNNYGLYIFKKYVNLIFENEVLIPQNQIALTKQPTFFSGLQVIWCHFASSRWSCLPVCPQIHHMLQQSQLTLLACRMQEAHPYCHQAAVSLPEIMYGSSV